MAIQSSTELDRYATGGDVVGLRLREWGLNRGDSGKLAYSAAAQSMVFDPQFPAFADLLLNSRAQDFAQAKKSALTDDLANRGAFTAQRIGSIRNLLNVMQVQNTDASNARSAGGFSLPTQMAVITSA